MPNSVVSGLIAVIRYDLGTPSTIDVSKTYHADRHPNPTPIHTLFAAGAIALLGLGAIGTVGAVQAQGMLGEKWHRGGPGFGGWGIERALGAAGITPDQRDEIASILDLAQTKVGPLAGELSGFREQVAILILDAVDRAAFETLRKEALTALDVLSGQGIEAFLDATEVLTAEQRAALRDRFGSFGRGFGSGFGPGGGTTDHVSYR